MANAPKAVDTDTNIATLNQSNYVDSNRARQTGPVIQNTLNANKSRQILKALADPIRLEVIHVLAKGERCVCDLTTELNLPQSKLSFHLKVLREAGLLADRHSGRWICYRLQPDALAALEAWLAELRRHCNQSVAPCPS